MILWFRNMWTIFRLGVGKGLRGTFKVNVNLRQARLQAAVRERRPHSPNSSERPNFIRLWPSTHVSNQLQIRVNLARRAVCQTEKFMLSYKPYFDNELDSQLTVPIPDLMPFDIHVYLITALFMLHYKKMPRHHCSIKTPNPLFF